MIQVKKKVLEDSRVWVETLVGFTKWSEGSGCWKQGGGWMNNEEERQFYVKINPFSEYWTLLE